MNEEQKKKIKDDYRNQAAVGAVYALCCSGNHQRWLKSTVDIKGIRNRFAFAVASNGCPDPSARREWTQYGTGSFSLEILEELKQKEEQSAKEFADDIAVLLELWTEKLNSDGKGNESNDNG